MRGKGILGMGELLGVCLALPLRFSCANACHAGYQPLAVADPALDSVFIFQMYLRSWAKELSVPILSIDYSLAPEAPFPRALEECFFVYAWCLNNFHHLGTNGKRVCVAGDSAGRAIFSRVYHHRVHRVTCMFLFQSTAHCKSHLVSFSFAKGNTEL